MAYIQRLLAVVLPLALLTLALGGCAMMDGSSSTTTTAQASTASPMGSRAAAWMRAGFEPFSFANCSKFEAVPKECEPAIERGE